MSPTRAGAAAPDYYVAFADVTFPFKALLKTAKRANGSAVDWPGSDAGFLITGGAYYDLDGQAGTGDEITIAAGSGSGSNVVSAVWSTVGVPPGVQIYSIDGPLFFGAAATFERTLAGLHDKTSVMILRLGRVPFADATAMHALADVVRHFQQRHIIVRVCEANPRVAHKLRAFGLMDKLGAFKLGPKDPPALRASAAEFILEGLYAEKRIDRNEDQTFHSSSRAAHDRPFERMGGDRKQWN